MYDTEIMFVEYKSQCTEATTGDLRKSRSSLHLSMDRIPVLDWLTCSLVCLRTLLLGCTELACGGRYEGLLLLEACLVCLHGLGAPPGLDLSRTVLLGRRLWCGLLGRGFLG